jgi:hypothetical protein
VTTRRRPPWAAALTILAFLLAWGEPVSLHPCPVHDAGATAAVAGAADAGTAHGRAATTDAARGASGHAEHAHAAEPVVPSAPHEVGSHVCQCLGDCSAASGVSLAARTAIRWQAVVRHPAEPPLLDDRTAPAAASPRLLPFANGPPAAWS